MVKISRLVSYAAAAAVGATVGMPKGVRNTGRIHLGPATINMGSGGLPSSLTVGPKGVRVRVWDRAGHAPGISSVNLPGPYSYRPAPTPAGRQDSQGSERDRIVARLERGAAARAEAAHDQALVDLVAELGRTPGTRPA